MAWLYRYETKGIQSWILSSNLLRDLAGGSALVESLSQVARREAERLQARVFQSTSGAMMAEFTDQEALQKFASLWPMQVYYRAPGLQLVQAWVPRDEGVRALFAKLIERRNRMWVTGFEPGPWVMRAARSGNPGVPTPGDIRTKARNTVLDALALAKERARKELRGNSAVVTGGKPWEVFEEDLDKWPQGPVAVIHADGMGVGKRLIKLGDNVEALERFSEAMKVAGQLAVRSAVEKLSGRNGKIFARPVVSAGDDLTYIVRASDAVAFAEHWIKAFERETESRASVLNGKIYAGAGIVFVSRRYPFGDAYRMAEELCSVAKKKLKASGIAASVLAFRRVTVSMPREVKVGACAWLVDSQKGVELLRALTNAVRGLPRGTLRGWLDYFEQGQSVKARQMWRRAAEVAEPSAWENLRSALEMLKVDPAIGGLRPHQEIGPVFSLSDYTDDDRSEKIEVTPIRDALTLRLVEKGGES